MKEKILNQLKAEIDPVEEMKKVSRFVDLAITETLKKEKTDQFPFLIQQLLNLKDYLSSEISHNKTQSDNTMFILELEKEKLELAEETKKKEQELKAAAPNQENSSEIDPSILPKEEEI